MYLRSIEELKRSRIGEAASAGWFEVMRQISNVHNWFSINISENGKNKVIYFKCSKARSLTSDNLQIC